VALRCKSEGRLFDSRWDHCNLSLNSKSCPSALCPGVDSSFNRNDHQACLLTVTTPGALRVCPGLRLDSYLSLWTVMQLSLQSRLDVSLICCNSWHNVLICSPHDTLFTLSDRNCTALCFLLYVRWERSLTSIERITVRWNTHNLYRLVVMSNK